METDINSKLSKIIDNINGQDIKLVNVDFFATADKAGSFNDKNIKSNLNIQLQNIGTGEAQNSDGTKSPIMYGNYKFDLKYSGETASENLIKIVISYKLVVNLQDDIENIIENGIKEVLQIFFDNTGRIILYPYFRHLCDLLIRESSFILPPLPPLSLIS